MGNFVFVLRNVQVLRQSVGLNQNSDTKEVYASMMILRRFRILIETVITVVPRIECVIPQSTYLGT